jgi:hypothetical protein
VARVELHNISPAPLAEIKVMLKGRVKERLLVEGGDRRGIRVPTSSSVPC